MLEEQLALGQMFSDWILKRNPLYFFFYFLLKLIKRFI